ncbi:MAG: UDP-N-acetylmuramoyl-tripeptide--D-alanyl-D-alanine ligase [Dysgonamonadaceae bacterium]|jgi:UDP-N-acetylmuramoyl-tripeptide--D-alanyl-D-alanine ligase|nr:UDP-N-acetylmuramoyl-tripeptide--D-alanyl-D-alanine ligase [Dysgonamonadaceae bacterium]
MNILDIYRIFLLHPVITTDTRNCSPGALFFALKGEHFDGNGFVLEALQKGCAYAFSDAEGVGDDPRIIHVGNCLETLQQLANLHRRQLNTRIIAVTGSNGKTTTKELTAAALSAKYRVLSTQGNLNNHIGVPLTLLQLTETHQFAVVEMGANHAGEILHLAEIAAPDYGLITNIGRAHLEGFGSYEGVVRAKKELYDYLRRTGGTAFVNQENPILTSIAKELKQVAYGTHPEGTFVWGSVAEAFPFLSLEWHRAADVYRIKTQLVGTYNLENVLAAIAIATFFQVDADAVCKAIEAYSPENHRSQLLETPHNRLIVDTYNANPSSMQVALEHFSRMDVSPKMLILGDMKELGAHSHDEHLALVDFIEKAGFDRVVLCGPQFSSLVLKAGRQFASAEALIAALQKEKITGYYILIKGSRSNQLEKVIAYL